MSCSPGHPIETEYRKILRERIDEAIEGNAMMPAERKLMDYNERGGDVADPWYTRDFAATYRDVTDGCLGLLHALLEKGEII